MDKPTQQDCLTKKGSWFFCFSLRTSSTLRCAFFSPYPESYPSLADIRKTRYMTLPKRILFGLFAINSFSYALFAQTPTTIHRYGVSWNRYYLIWTFRPQWAFHQEVDYRFLLANGAWHQLALHTHIRYRWEPHAEIALGTTRMENGDVAPNQQPLPRRVEWRSFQELSLRMPLIPSLNFLHRYRIEQRFLSNTGVPFVWRGRYRFQCHWTLPDDKWSVLLANEVFLHWGKGAPSIFDQNRLYIGLSHTFSPLLRAEIGYMMQWQLTNSADQLYLRDIVRFSLYHEL